jgi:hypothetical protein
MEFVEKGKKAMSTDREEKRRREERRLNNERMARALLFFASFLSLIFFQVFKVLFIFLF